MSSKLVGKAKCGKFNSCFGNYSLVLAAEKRLDGQFLIFAVVKKVQR